MRSSAPREVRIRLEDGVGQTTTARVFPVDQTWTDVTFDLTQLAGATSQLSGAGSGGTVTGSVTVVLLSALDLPARLAR